MARCKSYCVFKRGFDFCSALLLFLALSPLFLVLMGVVRLSMGAPVFFRQERTGKERKRFFLLKFRTMNDAKNGQGRLLQDEERLTPVGRFLRNSSLDELPELLNIIKGDMSVIGPRPLYPRYDPYYKESEMDRFKVRGGLIPPEVMYSDSFLSWDKQFEYEAHYARHLSLALDTKILISVFKTLFLRSTKDYGAYSRVALDVERADMMNKSDE